MTGPNAMEAVSASHQQARYSRHSAWPGVFPERKRRAVSGRTRAATLPFAGRKGSADACIESTDACIGVLQDCNAALLAYIAALWNYIVPTLAYIVPLQACKDPVRPFFLPARASGNLWQGNNEPLWVFGGALQSCIATMFPFFAALQTLGGSMQASAESMQDCGARG